MSALSELRRGPHVASRFSSAASGIFAAIVLPPFSHTFAIQHIHIVSLYGDMSALSIHFWQISFFIF
jgi:hypothetical protein